MVLWVTAISAPIGLPSFCVASASCDAAAVALSAVTASRCSGFRAIRSHADERAAALSIPLWCRACRPVQRKSRGESEVFWRVAECLRACGQARKDGSPGRTAGDFAEDFAELVSRLKAHGYPCWKSSSRPFGRMIVEKRTSRQLSNLEQLTV